jgi:DNA-binding transcriptional LysR family regulator
MEVRQLEAFLAVVDIESFTGAATRLHLAQPTVTARIQALEQEVGSTLLNRRSSGITPTTAGAELLPYAREIVALIARARDALGAGGEPHGRLDVGTIESLTNYRLLPVIEHIYRRYPKVQISMHSPPAGNALAQVRAGQLQCAFFIDSVQDRDDLEIKVLCLEPLALVCGRRHPLAVRPTVTNADLRNATLVRSDDNADYHMRFEHAVHVAGAEQRPRLFELGSIEAAKRSLANGMGIALMPIITIEQELSRGQLCKLNWSPPFTTFTQLAWRRKGGRNAALTVLVAAAVQAIEKQADAPRERAGKSDGQRGLQAEVSQDLGGDVQAQQAQTHLRHWPRQEDRIRRRLPASTAPQHRERGSDRPTG